MFAGSERRQSHFAMKTIWRGDVHHVNVRRTKHDSIIRKRLRDREFCRHLLHSLGQITQGHNRHPQPPQRFDVHRTNKTSANDASAELSYWFHEWAVLNRAQ